MPEPKDGGSSLDLRRPKIEARDVWKIYDTASGPVTAVENFTLDVADGDSSASSVPPAAANRPFCDARGARHALGWRHLIRRGADPKKPLNSVVFQEYAVFPWKTVVENVAFGLQMRGVGKSERLETAHYWLERVGLRKFAHYYPSQISGGMKQRVSIVRALANDPEVLLMDEPLGALDAQTRIVLQDELLRIWEETRKTVVYITHSLDEAILLGDRVILMTAHPGRLLTTYPIGIARPRTVESQQPRICGTARRDLASTCTRSEPRHGDADVSDVRNIDARTPAGPTETACRARRAAGERTRDRRRCGGRLEWRTCAAVAVAPVVVGRLARRFRAAGSPPSASDVACRLPGAASMSAALPWAFQCSRSSPGNWSSTPASSIRSGFRSRRALPRHCGMSPSIMTASPEPACWGGHG